MARRFGFDSKQNMALVGAFLGVPAAVWASPLLGLGLVASLTAPHLFAAAKRQRQAGGSAPASGAGGIAIDPEQWEATQQRIADLTLLAREQMHYREETEKRLEEMGQRVETLSEHLVMAQLALQEREFGSEELAKAVKAQRKERQSKPRTQTVARGARLEPQQLLERLQPRGHYNREQYLEQRGREHPSEPPVHLMPARLHWQEEILSGGMRFDFRPDLLRDLQPGARCALVATGESGAGQLVGYYDAADVFDVTVENLDQHWPRLEGGLGEGWDRENFERYLKGTPEGRLTVIEIGNVQRMRSEVDGRQFAGSLSQPTRPKPGSDRESKLLATLDANDAALIEEAGGAYPLGSGSTPSEPMLYRALRSKFRDGGDLNAELALPRMTEEDLQRLEERYGEAWRRHRERKEQAEAAVAEQGEQLTLPEQKG